MTKNTISKGYARTIGDGGYNYSNPNAAFSTIPLTINHFQEISDSPTSAPLIANEWSCGERRGIKDAETGDLLLWFGGPDKQFRLISSQDNGATWALVAADVTNPTGGFGYPNRILGVAQDSTGKVHVLARGSDSDQDTYYLRLSLTRSGGHVTNHTIEQTPFAFPSRNTQTNPDPRGDLKVVRIGGNERLAWCNQVYTTAAQNTTLVVYAGISTSIAPASLADFTGLNGSGDDSLIINEGGSIDYSTHLHETLIAQNANNEDLYFFCSYLNGDYSQVASGSAVAAYDLFRLRYTVSGATFTGGTKTVMAQSTSHPPYGLAVCTDYTTGLPWVNYMHPDNGVTFAYIDNAGSTQSGPASPLSTADRAGFMVCSVDNSKIHAIYQTYGSTTTGMVGNLSYYNGSSWNQTAQSSVADCNGYAAIQWQGGVAALRWDGTLPPQTQTAVSVATIYGT